MSILKDTRKMRIAKIKENGAVTNKILHFSVEAYTPILISNDEVIKKYTINTKPPVATKPCELVDVNGEVRYLHILTLESPVTLNVLNFYYDKTFEDIIIVPDLSYYDKLPFNDYVELGCYAIGGDAITTNRSILQGLTVDDKLVVKLPQPNVLTSKAKTHAVTMPGVRPSNLIVVNRYQENLADKTIIHGERTIGVLIELGTIGDVFGGKLSKIPAYLLHQCSHIEFGIKSLGRVSTGTNKLYLFIRF